MKRSSEPSSARWIDVRACARGCRRPCSVSPKRCGIWESSWIVPICQRAAERRPSCAGRSSARRRRRRPRSRRTSIPRRSSAAASAPSVKSHSSSVPSLLLGPRRELEARVQPEQVVEVRARSRGSRRSRPRSARRVQKMCASSCVMCLTRSSPCSVPAELVAVQRRRLGEADRQVAVAAQPPSRRAACGRGSSSA